MYFQEDLTQAQRKGTNENKYKQGQLQTDLYVKCFKKNFVILFKNMIEKVYFFKSSQSF